MKLIKNDDNLTKILKLIKPQKNNDRWLAAFKSAYKYGTDYGILQEGQLKAYLLMNLSKGRIFQERDHLALLNYLFPQKSQPDLTTLVQEAIEDLHEKRIPTINAGVKFADALLPLGFRTTVWRKTLTFDWRCLPARASQVKGKVKIGKWQDLLVQNGAAQLYEVPLHSTQERLTLNRPYWWWNRDEKVFPGRKLVVYYGPVGLPEGYLFYRIVKKTIIIDEIYADKAQGIKGLLKFLSHLGQAGQQYRLTISTSSHFENLLVHPDLLKIQIRPLMLTKIVDFSQILKAIKFFGHEEVILGVSHDDLCPWNTGHWLINNLHGKQMVSRSKQKADFTGTSAAWTQVLLGNLTMGEAVHLGLIQRQTKKSLRLDKGKVTFLDYL